MEQRAKSTVLHRLRTPLGDRSHTLNIEPTLLNLYDKQGETKNDNSYASTQPGFSATGDVEVGGVTKLSRTFGDANEKSNGNTKQNPAIQGEVRSNSSAGSDLSPTYDRIEEEVNGTNESSAVAAAGENPTDKSGLEPSSLDFRPR